jgi:Terminase small subunit
MSPKQQTFVREYLVDLNATAAYKRAGYRGRGRAAENAASRMLGNAVVQTAIKEALAERQKRTEIKVDTVVQETWNNYQRCVVAGQFGAANKALELLGRHVGAFPNKHEHTGTDNSPIPSPSCDSTVTSALTERDRRIVA